ncbi:MAG: alpha/beta fold hydrolase [Solirubrobacteraceae bacterium]
MLPYIEQGSGPAVLLIHGAGPDRDQWGGVMAELASDHRVVAYNRRGYAGSGEPVQDWDTHIGDAIELLEAGGVGRAKVVGHSAGTIVAVGVAARRPELVERLIAFDPILYGQKRPTFRLIQTVLKVQRLRKRDPESAVEVFYRWATSYSDGSGSAFDHMSSEDQAAMKARHPGVFADMDAGDGSSEIKSVDGVAGATVAVGELTDSWFAKNSRALARRLPDAKLETVERAGHAVQLDNPHRVAEIIRSG